MKQTLPSPQPIFSSESVGLSVETYLDDMRHREAQLLHLKRGQIDPIKQGREEVMAIQHRLSHSGVFQSGMQSVDDLLEAGERVQMEFDDLLMTVAAKTNGAVLLPGLKKRQRILEKIDHDYDGDANGVLDVVRGSIIFDSLEDFYRAVEKFHGSAKIVRVKDHMTDPTSSGYRDLKLNIELMNDQGKPFVAEVQFHLSKMHVFKEWEDSLYRERRKLLVELQALERQEGDPQTIETLKKRISDLLYEAQSVYAQVWDGYTKDILWN